MLSPRDQSTIFDLLDNGVSNVEIAKRMCCSTATIKKYKRIHLLQDKIHSSTKPPSLEEIDPVSLKILPVKDLIDQLIKGGTTNCSVILQRVQQAGYLGSYVLLNSYVRRTQRLSKHYKPSCSVETAPGQQAQVDWGSFGTIWISGRQERLYAFVYILSYSRALHVEFVIKQNQQTFQTCHINAFEKLGIPKTIIYDNVKTVVTNRKRLNDGSWRVTYNPTFLDFADYYGFEARACPAYFPRSKGKVEASVKFLRNNFMANEKYGRTYRTLEELNNLAETWLERVSQRVHRSTNETPIDRWKTERKSLAFPGNLTPYNPTSLLTRRSTKDAFVQYNSSLYSVPRPLAQKKLWVREIQKRGIPWLEIYRGNILVATHGIAHTKGEWVTDDAHLLGDMPQKTKKVPKDLLEFKVATRELNYYNIFK